MLLLMFYISYLLFFLFFFFFSSRRRHTRSLCDWSSDVCSSDLVGDLSPAFCCTDSKTFPPLNTQPRTKSIASRVGLDRVGEERSEEHTSELQSHSDLVCRLLLEKKKKKKKRTQQSNKTE